MPIMFDRHPSHFSATSTPAPTLHVVHATHPSLSPNATVTVPPPCYTSSKLKSARDTQKTPSQGQQRPSEVQPALRLHRSLHVQDILLKFGLLEQFEQSTMRALHGSPGE
jgi:hypothetical protein